MTGASKKPDPTTTCVPFEDKTIRKYRVNDKTVMVVRLENEQASVTLHQGSRLLKVSPDMVDTLTTLLIKFQEGGL